MEENEIYSVGNRQEKPEPENHDRENMKYFWSGLVMGWLSAVLVVSCVFLVNRVQAYQDARNLIQQAANTDSLVQANNSSIETEEQEQEEQEEEKTIAVDSDMVQKMQLIEAVIDTYFYQDDVDKQEMVEGAYKGMVKSLGDPYSVYYTAEELEATYQDLEGIFYGIGAYVSLDTETGYAKISGIISNSSAEAAEVRENDIIYEVDGQSTYGMELQAVVAMIRGESGTTVKVTFVRDGVKIEKEIVRAKVESETVTLEMQDDGVAYIQIEQFDTVTVDQFAEALAEARAYNMTGLVLDLRSNPGGSLSAVVQIARMLLPEGMIVYTEDRQGNRQEYTCDGTRELEVPLVVLVNGNSASASEILAGAIKDYGLGTLIGTTTYGKGIVQRPIELPDGSAVKLTISTYYTPNGTNLHGIGIEPDVVCEFESERYYGEERYDNQKESAFELIRSMIGE